MKKIPYASTIRSENDAILEIKQHVSISNITKIECMKSCDEQITLSMKPMFLEENNAIKNDTNI